MNWSNLKADYERLGTYAAVAAEYGVSASRVGQRARAMGLGRGYGTQNSPLEKLLQSALRKIGIGFTTQAFICGRFFADVLVNQAPVVIEADGAWHDVQKERDARRDAVMIAAGYKVYRFTGAQLNNGADLCVARVVEECGLVPDAEPEYVIRTSMLGPENPNWTGGLTAEPCVQCGKPSPGRPAAYAYEKRFCGQECRGRWMREHPEESPRRLRVDWNELPALYLAGTPMRDLQEKYGCGRSTLHRHLIEMGVDPRRRRPGEPPRPVTQEERARRAVQSAEGKRRRAAGRMILGRGADGRFYSERQPEEDTVRSCARA